MKPSLLVYFKAHSYGGTELLFLRMCRYFLEKGWFVAVRGKGAKEFITEYASKDLVERIDFSENSDFDYAICPAIAIADTLNLTIQGVSAERCIIWALGEAGGGLFENLAYGYGINRKFPVKFRAHIVTIYRLIYFSHFKQVKSMISQLVSNRSLVLSQNSSWLSEISSNLEVSNIGREIVIPVPIPCRRFSVENFDFDDQSNLNLTSLRVGWVGRISLDFKVYPLITTIRRLVTYCSENNLKLIFIVIGDGDAMPILQAYCSSITNTPHEIRLLGFMDSESAGVILKSNVDLMIGMGTAALDAASFGIPSVVVNAAESFATANLCKYRWLYESKEYSTGEFIEGYEYLHQVRKELEDILSEYLVAKEDVRQKCVSYLEDFDEVLVFDKILRRLNASTISLNTIGSLLEPLERRNERIRSISNPFKKLIYRLYDF